MDGIGSAGPSSDTDPRLCQLPALLIFVAQLQSPRCCHQPPTTCLQGIFFNLFLVAYLLSPRHCHQPPTTN